MLEEKLDNASHLVTPSTDASFVKMQVVDATCSHCVGTVRTALEAQYPDVYFAWDTMQFTLRWDEHAAPLRDVKQAVEDVGFGLQPCAPEDTQLEVQQSHNSTEVRGHLLRAAVGLSLGLACSVLCASHVLWGPWSMVCMVLCSTVLSLWLGWESYQMAWYQARQGEIDTHLLLVLGVLLTIGITWASCWVPGLHGWCDAPLWMLGFRHLGDALQAMHRGTLAPPPSVAALIRKQWLKLGVDLDTLEVGTTLEVPRGQCIPCDGVLQAGACVDTTMRGGQGIQWLDADQEVWAGMTAEETLTIRITSTAADSQAVRFDQRVSQLQQEKAQRRAPTPWYTTVFWYFVPVVGVAVAGVSIAVGASMGLAWGLQCAMAMLAAACPCLLGLVAPYSEYRAREAVAARITFVAPESISRLQHVNTVVLDLNGTLLTPTWEVDSLCGLDPHQDVEEEVRHHLRWLQQGAVHPVGRAVRRYLASHGPAMDEKAVSSDQLIDVRNAAGGRVLRMQDGAEWFMGNRELCERMGVTGMDAVAAESDDHSVWFGRSGKLMGRVIWGQQPTLKPGARTLVERLQQAGYEVRLCTGASANTAHRWADRLGLDRAMVSAACYDKAAYIRGLRNRPAHPNCVVAMVGDATNDALAVACSDVGILLTSLDQPHAASADIVVPDGDLTQLRRALDLGPQVARHVRCNVLLTLGYNILALVGVGVSIVGFSVAVHPGLCMGLMVLQSLCVLYNVSRFGTLIHQHVEACEGEEKTQCGSTTHEGPPAHVCSAHGSHAHAHTHGRCEHKTVAVGGARDAWQPS